MLMVRGEMAFAENEVGVADGTEERNVILTGKENQI